MSFKVLSVVVLYLKEDDNGLKERGGGSRLKKAVGLIRRVSNQFWMIDTVR